MTYRLIYGKTRDEMTSDMTFERLEQATQAYYLTEVSHWVALMDGETVVRHNTDTGPIVVGED